MTTSSEDRIYLNPPKFWSATKNMPAKEVDVLMDRLFHLAEQHDVEALKKFDFIIVRGRVVPNWLRDDS